MSMEEMLGEMVKSVDGAIGAIVGGFDGMAVAAVVSSDQINVEEITAAVAMALGHVQKAAEEIKGGDVEDLLVEMAGGKLYIKPLNSDYWFGLLLEPNANIGRAKLEMNKTLPKMLKEVS